MEELKSEETKSEDEEESAFPDTEISLQHVKGGKYELMKGRSDSNQSTEFVPIYLGDNQPVTIGDKGNHGGAKLSAKQRIEMRKAKKSQFQQQQVKEEEDEREETSGLMEESQRRGKKHAKADAESSSNQQQQQPKRGQKTKMKKIKEKYKDQDEEERHLRMEILAEAKKRKRKQAKKVDKGKGQTQEKSRPQSGANRPQSGKGPQQGMKKKPELVDIIQDAQDLQMDPVPTEKAPCKEDGHESDGEKQEEEIQTTADDMKMLDSLTGCPVAEDELLFGIPVCVPYNCLTNYKYKVKLLPGSTKRGKAAKTALNMFQHERSITPREKDLIKILKDADVSRNIPGKVKVTAPNLQKLKRK